MNKLTVSQLLAEVETMAHQANSITGRSSRAYKWAANCVWVPMVGGQTVTTHTHWSLFGSLCSVNWLAAGQCVVKCRPKWSMSIFISGVTFFRFHSLVRSLGYHLTFFSPPFVVAGFLAGCSADRSIACWWHFQRHWRRVDLSGGTACQISICAHRQELSWSATSQTSQSNERSTDRPTHKWTRQMELPTLQLAPLGDMPASLLLIAASDYDISMIQPQLDSCFWWC